MEPQCREGACLVPPVPQEAARAMRAWETMNALREFQAGSAVIGAMALTPFELDLVGVIEREVQQARRPAGGE